MTVDGEARGRAGGSARTADGEARGRNGAIQAIGAGGGLFAAAAIEHAIDVGVGAGVEEEEGEEEGEGEGEEEDNGIGEGNPMTRGEERYEK